MSRAWRLKKLRVMLRDNLLCQICGEDVRTKDISIDHIIPVCAGGTDHYDNLRLTHKKCNNWKNTNLDQKGLSKPTPGGKDKADE